ncbi:hypothetical protein BGW37DRAFT_200041 [Umbelopsis sp. PMI_123]|nr:hypothetical protein BGW37DRAFT_200041 [Umbelopsis sp. PMI_123]
MAPVYDFVGQSFDMDVGIVTICEYVSTTMLSLLYLEQSRKPDFLMCDEEQICMFLANNKLEYTGWIKIPDAQHIHYTQIQKSSRETVPHFKVLSFDIEVYTDHLGMPKSYRHDDVIFMIGVYFWKFANLYPTVCMCSCSIGWVFAKLESEYYSGMKLKTFPLTICLLLGLLMHTTVKNCNRTYNERLEDILSSMAMSL